MTLERKPGPSAKAGPEDEQKPKDLHDHSDQPESDIDAAAVLANLDEIAEEMLPPKGEPKYIPNIAIEDAS